MYRTTTYVLCIALMSQCVSSMSTVTIQVTNTTNQSPGATTMGTAGTPSMSPTIIPMPSVPATSVAPQNTTSAAAIPMPCGSQFVFTTIITSFVVSKSFQLF